MIKSKEDYLYYLECDRIALREDGRFIHRFTNKIWKFQRLLRKLEYYTNCKNNKFSRYILKIRYHILSEKLGFYIPINVVGPGLSIAHIGPILINGNSRIGENCRIQTGVTLGATNGQNLAPILGNNVFLGEGCKLIGNIYIADDVAIGANAVVVKDINQKGTTWGGVPARIISKHDSSLNLVKATQLLNNRSKSG